MLFAALSLCSLIIILVMVIKNLRASRNQWWCLFIPILLLLMTVAYRFDWIENQNNDLARYILDFEGLKRVGVSYVFRYADEYSLFWRLIVYVCCHLGDYHLFPALTICTEFLIFFYILTDVTQKNGLSTLGVLMCLILRLAFLPLIMSIAACRNTLAYSFFAMGVYMHYRHGLKSFWMYFWMILGVLTHTTVMIGVVIFALSFLENRYKWLVFLFALIGRLLGNVLVPILETSTNEYIAFFVMKWYMYINSPNIYDIVKNGMIIPGLLPILLLAVCWFLSRNLSPKKERTSYLVSNMAVTVGIYGVMAELFLRLCYPTALLMPLLWAEMKETEWKNSQNATIFWVLMIVFALVLFVTTEGCWLHQIYWFFEL